MKMGDYDLAKKKLKQIGLNRKETITSQKADAQSLTVMTVTDDYIHYSNREH